MFFEVFMGFHHHYTCGSLCLTGSPKVLEAYKVNSNVHWVTLILFYHTNCKAVKNVFVVKYCRSGMKNNASHLLVLSSYKCHRNSNGDIWNKSKFKLLYNILLKFNSLFLLLFLISLFEVVQFSLIVFIKKTTC